VCDLFFSERSTVELRAVSGRLRAVSGRFHLDSSGRLLVGPDQRVILKSDRKTAHTIGLHCVRSTAVGCVTAQPTTAVKTIVTTSKQWCHSDVAFRGMLRGKGSTYGGNSGSTSCSIISCLGQVIFVRINKTVRRTHYVCRRRLTPIAAPAIKSKCLLHASFHFVHTAGVLKWEREILASTYLYLLCA